MKFGKSLLIVLVASQIFSLWARTGLVDSAPPWDYVLRRTIEQAPSDREALFMDLIYLHLNPQVRHDNQALEAMLDELKRVKKRRYRRQFDADPKYRLWLMEALEKVISFNSTAHRDLSELGKEFLGESHDFKNEVRFEHPHRRLFLICYASSLPGGQVVFTSGQGEQVTVEQILKSLKKEQNRLVVHRAG